jgi:hypothetical protein
VVSPSVRIARKAQINHTHRVEKMSKTVIEATMKRATTIFIKRRRNSIKATNAMQSQGMPISRLQSTSLSQKLEANFL